MSSKTKNTATKEAPRPMLVPELRFPEFWGAAGWTPESGDSLFDQINDRNPEPGFNVLIITQEHGAIPRHMIDCHVSVPAPKVRFQFARLLDEIVTPDAFTAAKTLRSINAFTRDDGTPLNYTLVNLKDWCKNHFEVINQLRINTDFLQELSLPALP